MARSKLNKVTKLHLEASGFSKDPATDPVNGTDTPSKKKRGPKETASPGFAKVPEPGSKPKGIK